MPAQTGQYILAVDCYGAKKSGDLFAVAKRTCCRHAEKGCGRLTDDILSKYVWLIAQWQREASSGRFPRSRLFRNAGVFGRVRKKVEGLQRYAEFAEKQMQMEYRAAYEIWCFMPPNKLVTETVAKAGEEGLPVELVGVEEVNERIRQVALLEPLDRK